MSTIVKVKKAATWQTIEVFGQMLLQLVYFSVMARILDKEDYGLLAIINALVAIGLIFTQGGMGAALIQKKKINDKYVNGALQTSFLIGALLFFVFFIASSYLSSFYNDPRLEGIIKISSVNFIILAIGNISVNLLHRNFRFKVSAVVSVFSMFVGYALGICLAIRGYGVWSLIIATLLMSFIRMIGHFYYAPFRISFAPHFKEAKELFAFGSGMMLISLSNYLSLHGMNLILAKVFTPGVLGVFERGAYIKTLPSQILGNIIDKVLFPLMAEVRDEEEKLMSFFKFGLGLSGSIMIPATIFFVFFTPEIVYILMGDKWHEVVAPLQIMFFVLPLSNFSRIADSIIRAKGLIYQNVRRKYVFSVVLVLLSAGMAAFYGVEGAAAGVLISYLINYFMAVALVKKNFNCKDGNVFLGPVLQGGLLGAVMTILLLLYGYLCIPFGGVSVAGFFVFTLFLLFLVLIIAAYFPGFLGVYLSQAIARVGKQ